MQHPFRQVLAGRRVHPGWSVPAHELILVRRGCGTPRRRCPTTCRGWPPGSRPPPGWSWMSAARSGCSTAPPGWSVAGGWSSSAARRRRTRRRGWTRSSSAAIRRPRRRLEGAGPVGPGRGRLRRGDPRPTAQLIGLGRPGPLARRAWPSRPGRGDARRGGPDDARRLWSSALTSAGASWVRRSGRLAEVERRAARSLRRNRQRVDGRDVAWALRAGAEGTADPEVPSGWPRPPSRAPTEYNEGQLPEHARGRAVPRRPVRRGDPPAGGRHQAPGREGVPQDWAFLAMAHHRLGHRDEARAGSIGCESISPAPDPARSGTSWRSACSAARPRP